MRRTQRSPTKSVGNYNTLRSVRRALFVIEPGVSGPSGGAPVSIPDTELSVEVLTPNGWRQARLRVFQDKEDGLGVGLLLMFQGAGITVSLDSLAGVKLARTLHDFYKEEGLFTR